MKRAAAWLALCVGLGAGVARASSIGVYFAADGSDCDATIGANEAFTCYILANLYGDVLTAGITGAEFRVDNWPRQWSAVVTPNPASNITVGNPLLGGTNFAFPSCQDPDANGFVLLFTIDAIATTAVSNLTLLVNRNSVPIPENQCPMLSICDEPYTQTCVVGGAAIVNGTSCNVAVTPATWSNVKSLYAGWD